MRRFPQDIVNKLLEIMWTDWHCDVRQAASHALGRCGQGKAVSVVVVVVVVVVWCSVVVVVILVLVLVLVLVDISMRCVRANLYFK